MSTRRLLTLEIPAELTRLAESVDSTPAIVLQAFIADLCHLPGTNGSDERMYAGDWFQRVFQSTPVTCEKGGEDEKYDDDMGEYDAWREDPY